MAVTKEPHTTTGRMQTPHNNLIKKKKKKKLKNGRLVYFFTSAPLIYVADLYNCTDTSNGIIKNG